MEYVYIISNSVRELPFYINHELPKLLEVTGSQNRPNSKYAHMDTIINLFSHMTSLINIFYTILTPNLNKMSKRNGQVTNMKKIFELERVWRAENGAKKVLNTGNMLFYNVN